MTILAQLLLILALGAGLSHSPAWAQEIRINPVPPAVKPRWLPVPGAPMVYHAPNLPTDLFRYRGKYYFYWEGHLYQSKKPQGPWKSVKEIPAIFHRIDPSYFKTVKKEGTGAPSAGALPPPAPPGGPPVTPAGPGAAPPGPTAPPTGPPAAPEGSPPPAKAM